MTIEMLRQYRFGDFAYFDTFGSILGVIALSPILTKIFLKINVYIPLKSWIFFTFPIAVITHALLGQITPFNKLIMSSDYLSKIFIVLCLAIALKDIKIQKKSRYKTI